jgi:hypothetical protein
MQVRSADILLCIVQYNNAVFPSNIFFTEFSKFSFCFIDHYACLSHADVVKLMHLFDVIYFLSIYICFCLGAWVTILTSQFKWAATSNAKNSVTSSYTFCFIPKSLLLFSIFEFSEKLVFLMSGT